MDSPPKQQESMYQNVVNSLIKHPRFHYSNRMLSGINQVRNELTASVEFLVPYKPGVNLAVTVITPIQDQDRSRYNPKDPFSLFPRPQDERNALIYLHTHQGCRIEGLYLADLLTNYKASLCVFDFAGAGQSGGEYTSFGHFESEQIQNIVNLLWKQLGYDSIGLWGKSMGGSAAILYAGQFLQPPVKFLIVDSAFAKLKHAIVNIASTQTKAPAFAIKTFLLFVSRTVNSKAGFDIHKVRPIDHVDKINLPIRFIIGDVDQVVKREEFQTLYDKCLSQDKRIVVTPGDHAANRLEDPYCAGVIKEILDRFLGPKDGGNKVTGVLKNKHAVANETINPMNQLAYNREPVIPAGFDPKRLANSVHYHKIIAEKKRKDSEDPNIYQQNGMAVTPQNMNHMINPGQGHLNHQPGTFTNQPVAHPGYPNEAAFDTFGRQVNKITNSPETPNQGSPVSYSQFGFESLAPGNLTTVTQPEPTRPLQLRPSNTATQSPTQHQIFSPPQAAISQDHPQPPRPSSPQPSRPSMQGFNLLPNILSFNPQQPSTQAPHQPNYTSQQPHPSQAHTNAPILQHPPAATHQQPHSQHQHPPPAQTTTTTNNNQYPQSQRTVQPQTPQSLQQSYQQPQQSKQANPYQNPDLRGNLTTQTGNGDLMDSMAPFFAQ